MTTPIISWIAILLGFIMNGVYNFLDLINFPNVGLSIILYTVVIYTFMLPIQIKQQKFSRMMIYMQPEISAIQKKFAGKRDQASQIKMQEDISKVYSKYGVSPYGSCFPLLIQLPLLLSLYGVIQNIPGYITKVALIFSPLATKIICLQGGVKAFAGFVSAQKIPVGISGMLTKNHTIDALYRMTPSQWTALNQVPAFSSISGDITAVAEQSSNINSFFGINISESPITAIRNGVENGAVLLVIAAILVPVLAWFTQWINLKLTPSAGNTNADAGGASMNIMNNFMPVFSAVICFTFSIGIGIYWIAGSVIRSVQMVAINRHMMKIKIEDVIAKNAEKKKKKMEKALKRKNEYVETARVNQQARSNVKNIGTPKGKYTNDKEEVDYYKNAVNAPAGSLTARANMVRAFDEKHGVKPETKAGGKSTGKKARKNADKQKEKI